MLERRREGHERDRHERSALDTDASLHVDEQRCDGDDDGGVDDETDHRVVECDDRPAARDNGFAPGNDGLDGHGPAVDDEAAGGVVQRQQLQLRHPAGRRLRRPWRRCVLDQQAGELRH
jgi:hypothetical protein